MRPESRPLFMLLPGIAGAASLAVSLLAQAADTAQRPSLLARPATAASAAMPKLPPQTGAAPASRPKDGLSSSGKPRSAARSRNRTTGGDDDLDDLEVERARGKNR